MSVYTCSAHPNTSPIYYHRETLAQLILTPHPYTTPGKHLLSSPEHLTHILPQGNTVMSVYTCSAHPNTSPIYYPRETLAQLTLTPHPYTTPGKHLLSSPEHLTHILPQGNTVLSVYTCSAHPNTSPIYHPRETLAQLTLTPHPYTTPGKHCDVSVHLLSSP